jgi:hypothetical protein
MKNFSNLVVAILLTSVAAEDFSKWQVGAELAVAKTSPFLSFGRHLLAVSCPGRFQQMSDRTIIT